MIDLRKFLSQTNTQGGYMTRSELTREFKAKVNIDEAYNKYSLSVRPSVSDRFHLAGSILRQAFTENMFWMMTMSLAFVIGGILLVNPTVWHLIDTKPALFVTGFSLFCLSLAASIYHLEVPIAYLKMFIALVSTRSHAKSFEDYRVSLEAMLGLEKLLTNFCAPGAHLSDLSELALLKQSPFIRLDTYKTRDFNRVIQTMHTVRAKITGMTISRAFGEVIYMQLLQKIAIHEPGTGEYMQAMQLLSNVCTNYRLQCDAMIRVFIQMLERTRTLSTDSWTNDMMYIEECYTQFQSVERGVTDVAPFLSMDEDFLPIS